MRLEFNYFFILKINILLSTQFKFLFLFSNFQMSDKVGNTT